MSTPLPPAEVTAATENVVYYVDESELASISVDNQTQKTTELNQIQKSLQLILNNQNNMSDTIKVLIDNQKKLFHKVASLSIQIEDGFSKTQNKMSTDVVPLAKADLFERETFEIKPIDSIRELEKMELLLSDKTQKNKLLKQFSFVCSSSEGNGATCGYKVLDMFFSRDFLCKCSWTGGSRNSEDVKIGLKGYKNILKFFYELIRLWDKTYTEENNENFFKIVLKNSLKRKLSKNERASTKRRRTKKVTQENKGLTKNKSDQGKKVIDQNKTDENEKDVIDNNGTKKVALQSKKLKSDHENQVRNQNKADGKEKKEKNKDETKKTILKKKNLTNNKSDQVMNQIETDDKKKDVIKNDELNQIMNQNKVENEKNVNDKEEMGASDADDEDEINEDDDNEKEDGDIEE